MKACSDQCHYDTQNTRLEKAMIATPYIENLIRKKKKLIIKYSKKKKRREISINPTYQPISPNTASSGLVISTITRSQNMTKFSRKSLHPEAIKKSTHLTYHEKLQENPIPSNNEKGICATLQTKQ